MHSRLPAPLRPERAWALSVLASILACQPNPRSNAEDAAPSSAGPMPRHAPRPAPTDAADGGLLARSLPRIEYRGGPYLEHPNVVTVTFAKDDPPLVARLERLGVVLPASAWWRATTEGYCAKDGTACIGAGTSSAPVRLDDPLPPEMKASEVEALVVRQAKSGKLGPLDARSLFLVYLPAGVTLSDEGGRFCGAGPRAFHRAFELEPGKRVPFAVIPRCGSEAQLTGTASHELLEATTNPFPAERGFAFVGGSAQSGFTLAGLEPVDPCGLMTMDTHWTTESGFVVHRAWSNREAALAHDPCVPSRPEIPYAMVVPREMAVRLPKSGDSVTIEVDASAGRDTPAWTVSAFDVTGFQDNDRYLEATFDRGMVASGDTAKVTITSKKRSPRGRAVLGLVSTVGVHSHMWPLLVSMQ